MRAEYVLADCARNEEERCCGDHNLSFFDSPCKSCVPYFVDSLIADGKRMLSAIKIVQIINLFK